MNMTKYEVTIVAKIVKTITVEAENRQKAVEMAHHYFDPNLPDGQRHYEQETLAITETP